MLDDAKHPVVTSHLPSASRPPLLYCLPVPCPHAKKPHSQWEGKSRHKHTPMGVPESHAATCQPTPPRFLTKVVLRASTCSPNPLHPPPNNRKPRLHTTGSGVVKVSKFHPQSQKNKTPQQTSWSGPIARAQPPMSVHQGSQNNVEVASQFNHLRQSVSYWASHSHFLLPAGLVCALCT